MKLLVGVGNNLNEWNDACSRILNRPRLPIVYTFGGAFYKRGHQLVGLNFNVECPLLSNQSPFQEIYGRENFHNAIDVCDFAFLWGSKSIQGLLIDLMRSRSLRSQRVVVCSFIWGAEKFPDLKKTLAASLVRCASHFAKAVVLMTEEHAREAKKTLPADSIIQVRFGIDKDFYKQRACFSDVPDQYKVVVQKLLKGPFVIMPGDEQRLNWDAITFVAKTGIPLVRVCQYANADKMAAVREEVVNLKIKDLFFIFEKIDYAFFRFLLQHAAAYAGFVDSSWQPAGWTVACEAFASGLPAAIYEGLVSRELDTMNVGRDFLSVVDRGDGVNGLIDKLANLANSVNREFMKNAAQEFAATNLDLEKTGAKFVDNLEALHRCQN